MALSQTAEANRYRLLGDLRHMASRRLLVQHASDVFGVRSR